MSCANHLVGGWGSVMSCANHLVGRWGSFVADKLSSIMGAHALVSWTLQIVLDGQGLND